MEYSTLALASFWSGFGLKNRTATAVSKKKNVFNLSLDKGFICFTRRGQKTFLKVYALTECSRLSNGAVGPPWFGFERQQDMPLKGNSERNVLSSWT
ncbi:hypothetical protein A2716_01005 [candidate division WWE3 bacterium RIFCSPHIGHO2_01_FULL_40_23]|uniref:Uncharacterized protein n=1 Tax=candidate division WWE3 bacterium RIFCSPLOWO2_01_FULL_41_18 TaxID=1802625 RepID=A0A1F4VF27_UNCKA|nr:MAG: hypothetical protein A2716_01005 [candidate division WWE3 bacterium RIFCSPHIGHO2_01_FULL_40_23]OGC55568.1 MAG: hypothetical protein A3A78_01275 [candidate division WWE3 bacterium RIFCSPLOWO2_01_FULL_41_18]